MCLLSYYPPGIMPDPDELLNGALANVDGSGYALATASGRLIVHRNYDNPDAAITSFTRERRAHLDQPAMFHSRFGTAGVFGKFNVHPFKLGGDRRTVVAHNGVFRDISARSKPKERRSDTRIFAEDVMPRKYGDLDSVMNRVDLETYLRAGYPNKVAVITTNPRYLQRGYLFNGTAGIWTADGAWHSNEDYMDPARYGMDWHDASTSAGNPTEMCDICQQYGVIDPVTLVCDNCHYCVDCGLHMEECNCFTEAAGQRLDSAVTGVYPDEDLTWPAEPVGAWAGTQASFANRVADIRATVEAARDELRKGKSS